MNFTYYQVFIVIIFTVLCQFKIEIKEKIKASIDIINPEDVNNSNMTSFVGYLNIKMIKFITLLTSRMRISETIGDTLPV
jgi:hypothetical protein